MTVVADLDLQSRQLDGVELPGERAGEAGLELVGRDRREEADAAEVDPDHGRAGAEEARERAQHGAVAAEDDRQLGGRPSLGASPCFSASSGASSSSTPCSRPPRARAARLDRGRCVRAHGRARNASPNGVSIRRSMSSASPGSSSWTRWTTNSRFPFGPGTPESTTPTVRPWPASAASITLRTAFRCTSGSRTTPFGTSRAPGLELRLHQHERVATRRRASRSTAGSAVRTRMNDTSHVTSSGANGSSATAARVRPLEHVDARIVAERRVELAVADVERDHTPRARLEQAVREPARRGADVDAVAPRNGRPPSASSAFASLSPPRETKRGGASTVSSVASSSGVPGFWYPGTRPARTSAWAWARLSASPRSTSRTSKRFFTPTSFACDETARPMAGCSGRRRTLGRW